MDQDDGEAYLLDGGEESSEEPQPKVLLSPL
jgi:hypothetical protein